MTQTSVVSLDTLEQHLTSTGEYSWEIAYRGAECRFFTPEEGLGILYHLHVPEPLRNNGIGTAMIQLATEVLVSEDITEIHAQIRAAKGATEHVLSEQGFETLSLEKSNPDRTVIDGVYHHPN